MGEIMKRKPMWLGGAALLALVMCNALTTFDVTQTAQAQIPKGSLINQLLGTFDFTGLSNFDISQSQSFQNQGVKKEQIDSVKLKTLTLTITAPPSGQDFSFLESLKFYAEAPNQTRVLVAQGSGFGARTTIGLEVEDVELAPYAAAASMTLTTEATGHQPNNDTTIDAAVVFDVDVNAQGAVCGG
jgi:hypothetical protein